MSPVLMERYLTAARRISAIAVGDAAEIPVTADTYRVAPGPVAGPAHRRPSARHARRSARHPHLPARRRIHVQGRSPADDRPNIVVGLEYPHDVVLLVDGEEVHAPTIGGNDDLVKSFANSHGAAEASRSALTLRMPVKAGPHASAPPSSQKTAALRRTPRCSRYCAPRWTQWTTPASRTSRALVRDRPVQRHRPGRHAEPPPHLDLPARRAPPTKRACATQILSTLARRAYRRPLTEAGRARR